MKTDKTDFENISIPDGLEQRLSDNIDLWANRESRRRTGRALLAASSCVIALTAILVCMPFFHSFDNIPEQTSVIAGSNLTPEETARAMDYAFGMLQHSLQQSYAALDQANTTYESIKYAKITLYSPQ